MTTTTSLKQDDEFCFIGSRTPEHSPPPTPTLIHPHSPLEEVSLIDFTINNNNPFDDMFQICENQLTMNNSEKYLSIDVGFKNLSWCVLENSENALNKIIYEHGVQSIYSKNAN